MDGREPTRDESRTGPPARDIRERTFRFAVRVVRVCRELERDGTVGRTLGRQLLRAGTSIGANVEEARWAQSRADFINKNAIALKEARETHYWLRLLTAAEVLPDGPTRELRREAEELMNILGAIVVSARQGDTRRRNAG